MSWPSSISRLRTFYRTHGTRATMRRCSLALQRAISSGQMVLFYCDLPVTGISPTTGTLERKNNQAALSAADRARILSHWNPEAMGRLITERFAAHAELWLLREQGTIAAYGWTLKENSMEPHYFPLQPGDVHLFDFFVFQEFRGRGLNPSLVGQILDALGREGLKRALIEAAAWNKAQLSSLQKTPFQQFGIARKSVLGKPAVVWSARSGN